MQTVTLEEAQSRLAELIDSLPPGEEVVLTRAGKRIAILRSDSQSERKVRLGTMQGTELHVADDFDAVPEGFEDYLP